MDRCLGGLWTSDQVLGKGFLQACPRARLRGAGLLSRIAFRSLSSGMPFPGGPWVPL